jgi:anti-sigma-K factor RskA
VTAHAEAAAYVLDGLEPGDARAFERHLAGCAACGEELESLRGTAAALAFAVELRPPPASLRRRLLELALTDRMVVVPFRRRWTTPLLSAAAVAAACTAVVFGLRAWGNDQTPAGLHAYPVRGGDGTLLVTHTGEAVLVMRNLAHVPDGKTYEVWILRSGRAARAGLFKGSLVTLTRLVTRGAAVAVSLEPAGGSDVPTGRLLLRAETA